MSLSQFPARFGKYILLDRLNAGGMAELFRAKVTGVEGFERLVAIKCMLPQLMFDEQFINMFIDEARLAAQLSHANVVQIYELGRQAERLYIAMELVNGRDLRHILRTAHATETLIPASFAAYVVAKAAEGLDFAHRKVGVDGSPLNLVHRDVSPQNILVTYDGEVKVVDFGIAKASAHARSTETQAGVLKGKFAYMAPEQVAAEPTDRRADIFSLGAVLFEVITGERLFTGDNDLVVLEKVRDAVLPDWRTVLPAGAQGLVEVLQKALARRPDDRFSYASEMAEMLEAQLIEHRSIFGAKRAAQVMRSLYADEVAELADTLKIYAEVTVDNCVVTIGESGTPVGGRTVYESAFNDKTGEVKIPGHHDVIGSPPPAVSRAPTAAAPRVVLSKHATGGTGVRPAREPRRNPETGVGTRPRAMHPQPQTPRPAAGTHAPAARIVEQRPMSLELDVESSASARLARTNGAARVLRQLTRVAILALVLTSGLVFLVRTKSQLLLGPQGKGGLAGKLNDFGDHVATFGASLVGHFLDEAPLDATVAATSDSDAGHVGVDPSLASTALQPLGVVSLRVRGTSQAVHIFIDNKNMGTAPIAELALPVGIHHVQLVEAGRNGATQTEYIEVGPQHTPQAPLQKIFSLVRSP